MPRAARRARHEIGVDIVRTNDVHKWLRQQLSDIERLSGRTMPLQVSV
jgi:trehalose-6-phosphate synthase